MDAKVVEAPTADEVVETDKAYKTFLRLAGSDGEIDWMELKQILDQAMRPELDVAEDCPPTTKTKVNGLNAAPGEVQQTQVSSEGGNIIPALLSLLCGSLCKDTALAEIIPEPTRKTALCTSFSELSKSDFSKDICRSMVAMLDKDCSGKLNYKEFQTLWTSLRNWKNAWILHDTDKSGTFSGFELREVLNAAGYRLNNRILNVLMHRYGNKKGEINFDDFMMCAIKLKTMIDIYTMKDETNTNTASFTIEEWLECTLYS